MVARRAHNPEVVGSNPAPAPNSALALAGAFFLSGYETGERGSLGFEHCRCLWQMKAVLKFRSGQNSCGSFGHRKAAHSDNPEVRGINPAPAPTETE